MLWLALDFTTGGHGPPSLGPDWVGLPTLSGAGGPSQRLACQGLAWGAQLQPAAEWLLCVRIWRIAASARNHGPSACGWV